MFLRSHQRNKGGNRHRYFSVVGNRQLALGPAAKHGALSAEINDSQQQAWRKTLEVSDESEQSYCSGHFLGDAGTKQVHLSPDSNPQNLGIVLVPIDVQTRYLLRRCQNQLDNSVQLLPLRLG